MGHFAPLRLYDPDVPLIPHYRIHHPLRHVGASGSDNEFRVSEIVGRRRFNHHRAYGANGNNKINFFKSENLDFTITNAQERSIPSH